MLIVLIIVVIVLFLIWLKRAAAPVQDKKQSRPKMEKRHEDAARYIRNSGDAFAIRQLEQIKHRPEAYNYYCWKYADNNHTLKVALGLLIGYLTWDLLNDSSQEEELRIAMDRLEADMENDVIPTESDHLESLEQQTNEDFALDEEEMESLYDDLDDTAYFEEMMDDED